MKYGPYSPSRLETATCGYAFHRQYIDPAKPNKKYENLPQARGSAVHEVFEQITKKLISNPNAVFSADEIQTWVSEAVNRHPAAYPEMGQILEMAKLYIRKPPSTLTTDAGIELRLAIKPLIDPETGRQKLNPDYKLAEMLDEEFRSRTQAQSPYRTEQGDLIPVMRPAFHECHYDDPEAFARGRADIMLISDDTTMALVYDHKTQPNVEDADTFQLGFYAWVISVIYPFLDNIQTVLHFARYGHYSEPFSWNRKQLFEIEDEVMTRVQNIETRVGWEATPNKNCQYCPFLMECPAMAEFMERDANGNVRVKADHLRILGDTNKAVRVAGLINVLDELMDRAKGELKEHVKNSGPIAIPGKVYEYRPSEGIHWDKVNKGLREQAYAVFEKHGVDPKAFMSFNQTASKGVWLLGNEALVQELSELFPRKVETKFGGYKA